MANEVKAKIFNSNSQEFSDVEKKANANPDFQKVISIREVDGFTVDPIALVKEINSNDGEKDATFLTVTRVVKQKGQTVGEIVYLQTPDEETAYSTIRLNETKTDILYMQDGVAHQQIIANDEIQAKISLTECKALVAAICSAGFSGSIAGCAAGCMTFGPGALVCTPLCWGLVAVGCGYGASAACAWV